MGLRPQRVQGRAMAFGMTSETYRGARVAIDGYGLADAFDGWMRDGCFMYSGNHPHIRVLGTFARLILAKAVNSRPIVTL